MPEVIFLRENIKIEVTNKTTVLEAEIKAGLVPDAPCGGAGKCGKCLVKVDDKVVKACQTYVERDIVVDTLSSNEGQTAILTDGYFRDVEFKPDLKQKKIKLEKPLPGEKKSDWERLLSQLNINVCECTVNFALAEELYNKRMENADWYAIYTDHEVFSLNKEEQIVTFAAFDIGTTTIAGYLLDSQNGDVLAIRSMMNPQTQYGADVISRANYALENSVEDLSRFVRKALDDMLGEMCDDAKISRKNIYQVSIVGNTCMHHLFLGISPASLVHAPYTPVISQEVEVLASKYDININPDGKLLILPNLAGYVGADTCGCILTLRPDKTDKLTLMIDIGTNGEIVLGNKESLYCCSTAAGPAFEGAKIECGMRGSTGAIDHVHFVDGKWEYTTIDNALASGICGSGLIDLVAELCRNGIVDESGHMESGQNVSSIFMIASPENSSREGGVYITQKDISEIQLAKAAISTGIKIMMDKLEISEDDIDTVYIAGAFGNYMNPQSAAEIGIIPKGLLKRIKMVGNAAGEGAKIALLNHDERVEIRELARQVKFVELASEPDFQDCFIDELCFPEQE